MDEPTDAFLPPYLSKFGTEKSKNGTVTFVNKVHVITVHVVQVTSNLDAGQNTEHKIA